MSLYVSLSTCPLDVPTLRLRVPLRVPLTTYTTRTSRLWQRGVEAIVDGRARKRHEVMLEEHTRNREEWESGAEERQKRDDDFAAARAAAVNAHPIIPVGLQDEFRLKMIDHFNLTRSDRHPTTWIRSSKWLEGLFSKLELSAPAQVTEAPKPLV